MICILKKLIINIILQIIFCKIMWKKCYYLYANHLEHDKTVKDIYSSIRIIFLSEDVFLVCLFFCLFVCFYNV